MHKSNVELLSNDVMIKSTMLISYLKTSQLLKSLEVLVLVLVLFVIYNFSS
jgi:hypothetical protein